MARNPRTDPPGWWDWEFAFTAHVESRMEERGISELDLRTMREEATELLPGRHEPDHAERVAYVVTAFPTSDP